MVQANDLDLHKKSLHKALRDAIEPAAPKGSSQDIAKLLSDRPGLLYGQPELL